MMRMTLFVDLIKGGRQGSWMSWRRRWRKLMRLRRGPMTPKISRNDKFLAFLIYSARVHTCISGRGGGGGEGGEGGLKEDVHCGSRF